MILFKFSKTDGAEYVSHLDLLRHITRTLRRANIPVATSEGFNKHPRIFLNNPLGLGVKSVAEFGTIDTPFTGDFKTVFNAHSPKGVKCVDFRVSDKAGDYANSIVQCTYSVLGFSAFDVGEILGAEQIVITDLRNRTVDIRPRIFDLHFEGETLFFTLGCGENNLRPDLFCTFLESRYNGKARSLIKIASHGENTF